MNTQNEARTTGAARLARPLPGWQPGQGLARMTAAAAPVMYGPNAMRLFLVAAYFWHPTGSGMDRPPVHRPHYERGHPFSRLVLQRPVRRVEHRQPLGDHTRTDRAETRDMTGPDHTHARRSLDRGASDRAGPLTHPAELVPDDGPGHAGPGIDPQLASHLHAATLDQNGGSPRFPDREGGPAPATPGRCTRPRHAAGSEVTPDLGGQVAELQPLRCRPVRRRCSPASGGSLATARAIMTVGTPCPRVSRPGEG